MFRTHTCGELRISDVNKQVTLSGWVQRSRKMGGMTFSLTSATVTELPNWFLMKKLMLNSVNVLINWDVSSSFK